MAADKKKRLDQLVEAIQGRWGAGSLLPLAQKMPADTVPHISTGFPTLDRALGIGGLPRGRLTEITGVPTSGMNTLALRTAASALAGGEMAAYIDSEKTFDADYAASCGVDLAHLVLVRPAARSQVLEIARDLVASQGIGVLVVDASQELPGDMSHLISALAGSPCAFICLTRPDVPHSTYASVRLMFEKERWLYRRSDIRGYRVKVTIVKNKLAAPGRPVSITIRLNNL